MQRSILLILDVVSYKIKMSDFIANLGTSAVGSSLIQRIEYWCNQMQ